MMNPGIILNNRILDVAFISMAIAQLYKFIVTAIRQKQIVWSRLWETGGMPSSHSSSVAALTTAIAICEGLSSIEFAISAVFSVIVMYDASGIRKAAGQHANIINQITEFFTATFNKDFKPQKLKELLGHDKVEVLIGAFLGIAVAFAMKDYLS